MPLSNAQLLMLDTLIYSDYCKNNRTVGDILTEMESDLRYGECIQGCEMENDEWLALISQIRASEGEPSILTYTVQEYCDDPITGMRAAVFVDSDSNPSDVNVVFRGTSGDYEWHDNGEGGYQSDTNQQRRAAEYVNGLPEKYGNDLTVTGHSKGANKAQYVTIVTDRVKRCVSYDGQGFSQEFLDKYASQIAQKSNRITSISADKDFVNCLLFSIAGTRIYIDTEPQSNPLYYHKPNILLDSNGNLRPEGEQSELSKAINEYTTYLIANLDEPERSATIDGLIALLEKGEGIEKESFFQTLYAGGNALSHLDDFLFHYIGEHYGIPAELALTLVAAVMFPRLFMDDLISAGKKSAEFIVAAIRSYAEEIAKKLREFGRKMSEYADKFIGAVTTLIDRAKTWLSNTFSGSAQYISANPQLALDPTSLHAYAQRVRDVNRRISGLDRRMDSLYWQVGFLDLWNLLQADLLTGYSWKLARCEAWLDRTADDFETAEQSLLRVVQEG